MSFSQKVLRQRIEKIEGRYANYFKVGYNEFEFIIDFGQFYHDDENMHTRIITSPAYMKALLETLGKSIEECERVYGNI